MPCMLGGWAFCAGFGHPQKRTVKRGGGGLVSASAKEARMVTGLYQLRQGIIAVYASGGHLSKGLEKAYNQTKKALGQKIREIGPQQRARHSATKEATPHISIWLIQKGS